MTAKEMFKKLGYKQTRNSSTDFIEYKNDNHGDGDYKFVVFSHMWKEHAIGYYDNYETKTQKATMVSIKEHEAITKQMKELGWI